MLKRIVLVLLVTVCWIGTAYAQGPAAVFHDARCAVAWMGCSVDDAIVLPDGSFDCPTTAIVGVSITADDCLRVLPNDEHDNHFITARAQIHFGQPNPTGTTGDDGDVIAIRPELLCLFFQDNQFCRGNGALVLTSRTFPGLACNIAGTVTSVVNYRISPSGGAALTCFLPDPPKGE